VLLVDGTRVHLKRDALIEERIAYDVVSMRDFDFLSIDMVFFLFRYNIL
jgi:hypothetical protein